MKASKQPKRTSSPQGCAPPRTKEEAIQRMASEDPEKVAALLKEILRRKG